MLFIILGNKSTRTGSLLVLSVVNSSLSTKAKVISDLDAHNESADPQMKKIRYQRVVYQMNTNLNKQLL